VAVKEQMREWCVIWHNAFRAREGLPPLKRAPAEMELCVDRQAEYDFTQRKVGGWDGKSNAAGRGTHASFNDGLNCKGMGSQASCSWTVTHGYPSENAVLGCLNAFWSEKGSVYLDSQGKTKARNGDVIGHYLAVRGSTYNNNDFVSCGFHFEQDEEGYWHGWQNYNYGNYGANPNFKHCGMSPGLKPPILLIPDCSAKDFGNGGKALDYSKCPEQCDYNYLGCKAVALLGATQSEEEKKNPIPNCRRRRFCISGGSADHCSKSHTLASGGKYRGLMR